MLARRTILHPATGGVIHTPRLVPSFSSKGFPFFKEKQKKYSDTTNALETIGKYIEDSILLSAYDLHNGYLKKPERFYGDKELVFIDSGGYELSQTWDSTEPSQGPYTAGGFSKDDYKRVLRRLPKGVPFVITNFDWASRGKSLNDQILEAQELFNDFPAFLCNFLAKPTSNKQK
ncbi:MAG: hypothetical protein ACLQPD_14795 [Desulfomonilaceae bacterium]